MKKMFITTILIFAFTAVSFAGSYSNNLTRCLIMSTTSDDRLTLAKWFFMSLSKHPQMGVSVSDSQIDEANKNAGILVSRLLIKDCRMETKEALQNEGRNALTPSFQALGQIAGEELVKNREVMSSMGGYAEYLNMKGILMLGRPE